MADTPAQLAVAQAIFDANPQHKGAKGQLHRVLNFMGQGAVEKVKDPVRIGVLGASQVWIQYV